MAWKIRERQFCGVVWLNKYKTESAKSHSKDIRVCHFFQYSVAKNLTCLEPRVTFGDFSTKPLFCFPCAPQRTCATPTPAGTVASACRVSMTTSTPASVLRASQTPTAPALWRLVSEN